MFLICFSSRRKSTMGDNRKNFMKPCDIPLYQNENESMTLHKEWVQIGVWGVNRLKDF